MTNKPKQQQKQVGWGFEQCDLVEGVPVCGRGFATK